MLSSDVGIRRASIAVAVQTASRWLWFVGSLALFLLGLAFYALTGRTPRVCFHAMRRIYGPTNGAFNRLALAICRLQRPIGPTISRSSFIGDLSAESIQGLVDRLDADGYVVFQQLLSPEMCDSLEEFARCHPCTAMGETAQSIYSESTASALRYDFEESSILSNPVASRIAFDGALASIAGAYFRCRPIYDFTTMWWTTPAGVKNYSAAAQEFHFDMDRLAFLKFFIYLTDVTQENGPHIFVAGSHKHKPAPLRAPRRFEDHEVESSYPDGSVKQLCGPRGTIFAADTVGIHKGRPVQSGHRLVFQVEFTISKFGQNYSSPVVRAETLRRAGLALPLDARVYPAVTVMDDG